VGGKKIAALIIRGLQRRPHTTSTDRQLATAVVTVDFSSSSLRRNRQKVKTISSLQSQMDDDNKSMPCKEKIARDAKSLTHLSLNTLADALDVVRLISSTL
jgi:hypothetical protein